LTKHGLGYILGEFLHTHLVTLASAAHSAFVEFQFAEHRNVETEIGIIKMSTSLITDVHM
jgi:hypothetical protein